MMDFRLERKICGNCVHCSLDGKWCWNLGRRTGVKEPGCKAYFRSSDEALEHIWRWRDAAKRRGRKPLKRK